MNRYACSCVLWCTLSVAAEDTIEKPPAPPPDVAPETTDEEVRAAIRAANSKVEKPAPSKEKKDARDLIVSTESKLKSSATDVDEAKRKVADSQAEVDSAKADLNRANSAERGASSVDGHLYHQQAVKAARRLDTANEHLQTAQAELRAKQKTLDTATKKALLVIDHFSDYFEPGNDDHKSGKLRTFKVIQICSQNSMIVKMYDQDVWIDGVSTDGLVDGQSYKSETVVKENGTHRYVTVLGSSRTIAAAIAVNGE